MTSKSLFLLFGIIVAVLFFAPQSAQATHRPWSCTQTEYVAPPCVFSNQTGSPINFCSSINASQSCVFDGVSGTYFNVVCTSCVDGCDDSPPNQCVIPSTISVNPDTSYTFPSTVAADGPGGDFAERTFTITASGGAVSGNVSFIGANRNDFSCISGCPYVANPGLPATITIRFDPPVGASGNRSAIASFSCVQCASGETVNLFGTIGAGGGNSPNIFSFSHRVGASINPPSVLDTDTVEYRASASDVDNDLVEILIESRPPGAAAFGLVQSCLSSSPGGEATLSCSGNEGPFAFPGTLTYRITAFDDIGNTDVKIGSYTIVMAGSSEPTLDDLSHSPPSPVDGDTITYRATFSDPDGIERIIMQEIVNGVREPAEICSITNGRIAGGTTETCTITGGPHTDGTAITYEAIATDRAGNTNSTEFSNSFTVGGGGGTPGTLGNPCIGGIGGTCNAGLTCNAAGVCESSGGGAVGPIAFPNPLGTTTFTGLVNRIIDFLFTIAVIVAPVLLVIAGVIFMTAAGDPSRVATARRMLTWTIVGFGIILISKGLVEVLRGILGI